MACVHRRKHKSTATAEGAGEGGEEEGDDLDPEQGPNCMAKLICLCSQNEKVIGFHYVGPNAGEVTQGFALALKLGATKADFDDNVGEIYISSSPIRL